MMTHWQRAHGSRGGVSFTEQRPHTHSGPMKSPRVYSALNFRKGSDRKGAGVNERAGRMVWARD